MKRILGAVTCLGLATIYSATLLFSADEATGITDENAPYTYDLSKHEFDNAERTSFTLDVTPKRPDLVVTAVCHLQDEQQGIGYFPLANVNADVADAAVKFRISCLANAFIKTSTIRVEIREKKTNRQIGARELPLQDAVPEVAGTAVKER